MYEIKYTDGSQYDGADIMVIATGIKSKSNNPKTGDMIQIWIMPRNVAPHDAVKSFDDRSVCGECPLRPSKWKKLRVAKKCYVETWQAPLAIYKAYHRGNYETVTPEQFRTKIQGKSVRLGAWGDPASVKFEFWESIGVGSGEFKHTGYTHGYLLPNFDKRHLQFNMISLDPVTEQMDNVPSGRSFRVINSVDEIRSDEIICPASEEGGYKTTCEKCLLCSGSGIKAKNIAIVIH